MYCAQDILDCARRSSMELWLGVIGTRGYAILECTGISASQRNACSERLLHIQRRLVGFKRDAQVGECCLDARKLLKSLHFS